MFKYYTYVRVCHNVSFCVVIFTEIKIISVIYDRHKLRVFENRAKEGWSDRRVEKAV
jgi:hypothetical protein